MRPKLDSLLSSHWKRQSLNHAERNSPGRKETSASFQWIESSSSGDRILKRTVCAATTHTVGLPSYDIMQDTDLVEGEEPEEELEAPPTFPTYANICAAYRGPQRGRQQDRDRQRPQHRYTRPPAPNQQRQRPQQDRRQRSRNGNFAESPNASDCASALLLIRGRILGCTSAPSWHLHSREWWN